MQLVIVITAPPSQMPPPSSNYPFDRQQAQTPDPRNRRPAAPSGADQQMPRGAGQQMVRPGNPPLALEGCCPVTLMSTKGKLVRRGNVLYGAIHRNRKLLEELR